MDVVSHGLWGGIAFGRKVGSVIGWRLQSDWPLICCPSAFSGSRRFWACHQSLILAMGLHRNRPFLPMFIISTMSLIVSSCFS